MSWFDFFRRANPDQIFTKGQEISIIANKKWVNQYGQEIAGPKFNEIVRVRQYDKFHEGNWYIQVSDYPHSYLEKSFAPVISDDKLEEMVNAIDQLTMGHGHY